MSVDSLGMPADLRSRLEYALPRQDGQRPPVVHVTPRDADEHRCAAWCADHYEVAAFYSASGVGYDGLEWALKLLPSVYITTHAGGGKFSNPDWPAPLGSRRRDRTSMRQQVIALMRDPEENIVSRDWSKAVITVNAEAGGRGFVVELDDDFFGSTRYVLTAAHCLPELPPAIGGLSFTHERTWSILGPLGEKATVWAECLFVDPVADIAVLGQPDNQILSDEADAYDELIGNVVPLPMGSLSFTKTSHGQREAQADVFLLSLQGHWFESHITSLGRTGWTASAEPIAAGMSGSPIVTRDGKAIGLVASTAMHPLLVASLPGWMARS